MARKWPYPTSPGPDPHMHEAIGDETTTVCHECGNPNLAAARATWTDDGSSFCPFHKLPGATKDTPHD